MSKPENIGEQLTRIEVADQSSQTAPIKVHRGIGERVLGKLSGLKIDNATLHEAGVIRGSEAQRAAELANRQPLNINEAGAAIAKEPISAIEKEKALHIVKTKLEESPKQLH